MLQKNQNTTFCTRYTLLELILQNRSKNQCNARKHYAGKMRKMKNPFDILCMPIRRRFCTGTNTHPKYYMSDTLEYFCICCTCASTTKPNTYYTARTANWLAAQSCFIVTWSNYHKSYHHEKKKSVSFF